MTQVNNEGNIIWIASFPKSGNTWLRVFFNNLISKSESSVNINQLNETYEGSSDRLAFDKIIGVDSSDLTLSEIDYYLPKVHLFHSRKLQSKKFIKTHDAFLKNNEGEWIIPILSLIHI